MYLRHTIRKKEDGKVHRYWTLVRSVRVGRRVIQQAVAQLGELDERGRIEARALARRLIGASDSGPSARGVGGELRLAATLLRARIAPGERREPVEKRRRPKRPADRLGGAQRRDEGRVRLLGDQLGEAPAAARQQRRDLDQPVVSADEMRPHARPRPILGALDEPRPNRVHRHIACRRHQAPSSIATEEKRAWKRCPVTRLCALTKPE